MYKKISALVLNQSRFFIFSFGHKLNGKYFKTRHYSYTYRYLQAKKTPVAIFE